MPTFTSPREKRLWIYTFIVFVGIISTLIFSRPLTGILSNQNIQAAVVLVSMVLTGATVIVHGLKTQPNKAEIAIWLGFIAVYLLFFFRLGHAERSHLMEYSVLAIFIHQALIERAQQQEDQIIKPAILAFVVTLLLGVLDEGIQFFLPSRVFDPLDMVFNGLAAFGAIGTSLVLQWVRKKIEHTNK